MVKGKTQEADCTMADHYGVLDRSSIGGAPPTEVEVAGSSPVGLQIKLPAEDKQSTLLPCVGRTMTVLPRGRCLL